MGNDDQNLKTLEFVELLSSNYRRIFAFILTLVPNYNDAEDIMQETCRVLWQKVDQFTPGTDFAAWAVTIAKYNVLDALKKKKRFTVPLSEDIIDLVSEQSSRTLDHSVDQFEALQNCFKKLKSQDQKFIELRFKDGKMIKDIAGRIGVSVHKLYRNESRIIGLLMRCIRRNLAFGEVE